MRTPRILIQVLATTLAVPCFAASNDIERAILSFPKINALEYRPDTAADSVNELLSVGKDAACAALQKASRAEGDFGEDGWINEKVCHLCRLLFTSTNTSEPLRAPRLGASTIMPYESLKPPVWPDLPFAIIKDVPLSMNLGYAMVGRQERAETYLAYCKENGALRTKLYPKPTFITASNALNQVFNSPAWKTLRWKDEGEGWHYTLNEDYAKQLLWKQVENMAKASVQQK